MLRESVYLLEVVFDEAEDKAPVHEGEGVVDEEGQASVEAASIVHVLRGGGQRLN